MNKTIVPAAPNAAERRFTHCAGLMVALECQGATEFSTKRLQLIGTNIPARDCL